VFNQIDRQLLSYLERDVVEIAFVVSRDQHMGYISPLRGQQLFGQPADGEHPAPECDLTGHRQFMPDRSLDQRRHQGRGDGDAGGRPILRDRTLRDVDMDIELLVEIRLQPEQTGPRTHVTERGLGRLLHDIAQFAGA